MNENFESSPVDMERENALKEKLISELTSASSIEDLAKIKSESLTLDERTGYRMQVHLAIVKQFEKLLRDKVRGL